MKRTLAGGQALAAVLFVSLPLLASDGEPHGALRATISQEVAIGGMVRTGKRDPGLVGAANGGTGTSVNFDDGNLNYGRGFTALAAKGRTAIELALHTAEAKLEAVYLYDAMTSGGRADFHPLGDRARDLVARFLYLDEAYVGIGGVRLGNQLLRWSDSPSFGISIAPIHPIAASRRYQPGFVAREAHRALPMLTAKRQARGWVLEGFYLFRFEPSEGEAAGTFLSGNDYYSPGARYLQLGQGSPLVPDSDFSVVTSATPFGSRVPRGPDREPGGSGQYGARVESPQLGPATLALYAMRVHSREPIVSVRTGTLGGLLRTSAADYTSSGAYFVEYVPGVTVVGASARLVPAPHSRVSLDYSMRRGQPLQVDDDALIGAGLAPAAAVATCAANPASAVCGATLTALNRNPVIVSMGGIDAANAAGFFATEIPGYRRFDVSQYAASLGQGLPPMAGASAWTLFAEAGGIHVHGFKEGLLDASVSIRPDAAGSRRPGLATRSAWGYRLSTRLDYANVLGARRLSPSITWIHDARGNAPINIGTLLAGTRGAILAVDCAVDASTSARMAYRKYINRGDNADRFSDREFVSFSLSRKF